MLKKIAPIADKYLTDKRILFLIIFAIVYVSFKASLEKWLSDNVVKVFQNFTPNVLVNILLFLGLLLLGRWYLKAFSRKYLPSIYIVVFLACAGLLYSYYRFYSDKWDFILIDGSWVAYTDTLLVVTILSICLYSYSSLRVETLNFDFRSGFLLDEPLNDVMNDTLGRSKVAKTIASKIDNTEIGSSLAIGIIGKWGTGKTSFMYLIQAQLSPNDIIVHFNPWSSKSPENIIEDFFKSLSEELSQYDGDIAGGIKTYSKQLSNIDDLVGKFSDTLQAVFQSDDSLQYQKEEINRIIERIGKRIIIFIDDLDRLDQGEVIQVIKLIRNTANFKNTAFVVAYDRGYISGALENVTTYNSELFLEKIFQIEIPIPKFESYKIREILLQLLSNRLSPKHYTELETILLHPSFERRMLINSYLNNLRDVSRFINGFLFSYELLNGEIVLDDLLNIECIRLKYPSVYNLLFEKRTDFMTIKKDGYEFNQHYILHKTSEKDHKSLRTYLEANYKEYNVPQREIEQLIESISIVFPSYRNTSERYDFRLSISHPNGFNRYFAQRLLTGELSENEYSKYILLPSKEFNKQVEIWVDQGLRSEVLKKLESITKFNNKADFEKNLSALFHCLNIPKIDNLNSDHQSYNEYSLYNRISDEGNVISDKYYKGDPKDYEAFLRKLFNSIEEPYTENYVARTFTGWLFSKGYNIVIPENELMRMNIESLSNHIKSITSFSEFNWAYWHDCKKTIFTQRGNQLEREYIFTEDLKSVMKSFIFDRLDSFLVLTLCQSSPESKYYLISDIVKNIFGSYEEWEAELDKLKDKHYSYLSEYKSFCLLFRNAGYKAIPFKFKTIAIPVTWR